MGMRIFLLFSVFGILCFAVTTRFLGGYQGNSEKIVLGYQKHEIYHSHCVPGLPNLSAVEILADLQFDDDFTTKVIDSEEECHEEDFKFVVISSVSLDCC
jgi:hypothetical protein